MCGRHVGADATLGSATKCSSDAAVLQSALRMMLCYGVQECRRTVLPQDSLGSRGFKDSGRRDS